MAKVRRMTTTKVSCSSPPAYSARPTLAMSNRLWWGPPPPPWMDHKPGADTFRIDMTGLSQDGSVNHQTTTLCSAARLTLERWLRIGCLSILALICTSYLTRPSWLSSQFSHNRLQVRSLNAFPARQGRNAPHVASGYHGAVASEDERCSNIGVDVLKDNGTATDAAIATAICIGVVNCFSSGIGGGGFMVIKPRSCHGSSSCEDDKPIAIDFRETITDGTYYSKRFREDPSLSQVGGLSVGIPGELAGLAAAYHKSGGGVSWQRLFEPSVQLAQNFSVGSKLQRVIYHDGTKVHAKWIKNKPEWSRVFFPRGVDREVQVGDFIQRPQYSRTLELIGKEGSQVFYRGSIAQQLVDTINREGGRVSLEDFQNYKVTITPALHTTYHGRDIFTTEAPSSGPMLIYLLNILEGYPFNTNPRTALSDHRFLEALKYTFAARTELADPAFLNHTELSRIEVIKSKAYAAETFSKIDDNRTYDYLHYKPHYDVIEDHGTTHLSVVDQFGSSVSLTSTVNLLFGSQIMDPDNGVILNDENDDFSIKGHSNYFNLSASALNYPEKGKRPLSSIAPIIVENNGRFHSSFGASGGSRIFSAIVGSFLKLDWGYDLETSISDPRIHHQLLPNLAEIEETYREDFLEELKRKGHNISMVNHVTGKATVQGIMRKPDGLLVAVSDYRKHGIPAAY